jgi:hypothetical protein
LWVRLERLARDKHYLLLPKSINYGRKSFIVQAPGVGKEGRFINDDFASNFLIILPLIGRLLYSTEDIDYIIDL